MNAEDFETHIRQLRPRLHRYCARITGSAVDGDDAVQDTLIKALRAQEEGLVVDNLEVWLLRIAHNTCLDFVRRRTRHTVVPLTDDLEALPMGDTDMLVISFRAFLQLPELQRCAVILKDVLGHSVDDIANIAHCTAAAAKSALQRGRKALRQLADMPEDASVPLMSDAERQKMRTFVRLFQSGSFDAIRGLLAEDVKLDLVNRLKLEGRDKIAPYFTRYAEETKWRFSFGAIDGSPAVLVFDSASPSERPAHFVLIDWRGDQISGIRDFLFAPYVAEAAEWTRLY
jgi:RNA polymerase sigma factor (sigma-70 family)